MKLKDALDNYYVYSGKASDIVRQLALGGIAIIWLFQVAEGSSRTLPSELFLPLKLIVAALAADLLQYAVGGVLWSVYHRYKEGRTDLSMELVANQAVSPGLMVSGFDQFRRTLAGGL